jgi:hypothetical protein
LKIKDAPKAQREGSQTCNVWSANVEVRALKERQNLPRLQRGEGGRSIPEVSPLATFFTPLRGKVTFQNILYAVSSSLNDLLLPPW